MCVCIYIISEIIQEIINTPRLICKLEKKRIIMFYGVFKNYLIYIRNTVQHIYYFVSKKQKIYLLRYLKSIYYIFYKFENIYLMMSNLQVRTNKEY